MEITYDDVLNHVRDYFDTLPKMEKGGPQARSLIEPFFSPDITVRGDGEYPVLMDQNIWLNGLSAGHHKYIIYTRPPIGYVIVDGRKHLAVVFLREDVQDNATGEIIRVIRNNAYFAVHEENGELKFIDELISRIPGKFQVDKVEPEWKGLGENFWEEMFPKGLEVNEGITYEAMEKLLKEYFDFIPKIKLDDSESRAKFASFMTSDFKIRHMQWPRVNGKDEWVNGMCRSDFLRTSRYKYEIQYDIKSEGPSILPTCYLIDDRQNMGAAVVIEKLFDRTTGRFVGQLLLNMHFAFAMEDGELKIKWQLVTRIPTLFWMDVLPK